MTLNEVVAAAMHAALLEDLYPDTAAHTPEVTTGDQATTVLMSDHHGDWIVAIHYRTAATGDWYITGGLPPGAARAAAAAYASGQ